MNTPRILATTIASLVLALPAFAVTDTWDGGGADNNFSTGLNWLDNTAPVSDLVNTDLIFAGVVDPAPNVNAVFSANSITFDNTAAAFTIGGSQLNVGAGGIVNNDANLQTFNNVVALGTATGTFSAASGALAFSSVALGTNALTFTGTAVGTNSIATITGSGSLTRINGNLTYGAAGAVTQAWDLAATSTAQVSLNATTDLTVSTTGSITVSGATFNANGNVTMDATPFLLSGSGSVFTVAGGKTLTLQNGASLSSTSNVVHSSAGTVTATGAGTVVSAGASILAVTGSGSTLNVLAGADTISSTLIVGGSGAATVLFDGVGTTVTAGGAPSLIGNGATGMLTFANGATGGFTAIHLATFASSNGTLNIQSGASVTVNSLLMVDDAVASESGTLTINGAGSALAIGGAGTAAIGAASLSSATVAVQNSGTFTTGTGTTTVNATGTISITGGTFNANGNLTLNGGDLTRDNTGVLSIASGRTLTVQAGGTATIASTQSFIGANLTVTGAGSAFTTSSGNININSGSTVQVTAGGHLDSGNALNIGNAGVGTHTLTIDGAGSQLSSVSGGTWGAAGGVTNVTFSNSAAGSFGGSLQLGNHINPASAGTVLVQSGADVSSAQLLVANTVAASSGSVTVTGTGSTWTVSGGNAIQVGAASGSTATLTVASGGVFNSGTGNSVMNPTGTLALNGGTFVANGGLTVNGGQFTRDLTGTFTLPAARGFFIQSGGDAIFTGPYINSTASTINVTGVGSTFSATSDLIFNNGSVVNVTAGGAISNGAAFVVISGAGNASVTVDGAGSSFTGGTLSIGVFDAGSLAFSNGSTGAFGSIIVQDSPIGGGSGALTVQSGATLSGTGFAISANATVNSGVATITGAGSALTINGAGTTQIGAGSNSTATLNIQNGGAFTSGTGTVSLNATGVINIDGGSVNLLGPLADNGGVVDFTSGSLSIISNWNIGLGGLLGTDVTFDAARQFTTTATTTIDNFHTLTLNGGTFSTGALVNNGALAFNSGTLAATGAGGFNIGTGALGANVTLGSGANLQVTNSATVASGATLTLNGGAFTAGALNVTGTVRASLGIASVGAVTNNSGGRVFVGDTLSASGAWTNAAGSQLTLQNGGLVNGAGTITNSGLVTGDGTITNTFNNNAGGEVRGEFGKTLYFTGATGANAGRLNLLGGTLSFAQQFTNSATGQINGEGALYFPTTPVPSNGSPTAGLMNEGNINLTGGDSQIYGTVQMQAGSRLIVSGGATASFFDVFRHSGTEVRASAGSAIVFFGEVRGAGSFTGTGTIYFEGGFSPGNSPASVLLGTDIIFGDANALTLELGGLAAGSEYDQLIVGPLGSLALDGELVLDLIDGFEPHFGDTFQVLDFDPGQVSGAFDEITFADALPGDLSFDTSSLSTSGTVTVVPEPGIGALLASALALLGLRQRHARRIR